MPSAPALPLRAGACARLAADPDVPPACPRPAPGSTTTALVILLLLGPSTEVRWDVSPERQHEVQPEAPPQSRLKVVLAPAELRLLDHFRSKQPRAAKIRDLIEEIIELDHGQRDELVRRGVPDLPAEGCKKVDVRMPAALRERLHAWCGEDVMPWDAIRGALIVKGDEYIAQVKAEKRRQERSCKRGRVGGPSQIQSAPSARVRAEAERQVKVESACAPPHQRGPAPHLHVVQHQEPVQREAPDPVEDEHLRTLEKIAARVKSRIVTSQPWGLIPVPPASFRPATGEESARLRRDIYRSGARFQVATAWTDELEIELARAFAVQSEGTVLRVIVGAWSAEDGIELTGLDDPEAVAEQAWGLCRFIGRPGRYVALAHVLSDQDGNLFGVTELVAVLEGWELYREYQPPLWMREGSI